MNEYTVGDFIWNIQQEGRIAEARTDASDAKNEVSRYKESITELEFSLNRMALASQALWELLRQKVGLTEAELLAKISEVDLRDGVQDQRMAPRLSTCPKCGKTVNTRSSRCIYCGSTVPKPHVFQ